MRKTYGVLMAVSMSLGGIFLALGRGAAQESKTAPPAASAGPEPCEIVYENNFEAENALTGWIPLSGMWALTPDETSVLRQTQASFRGLARIVRQPMNYEVAATIRPLSFSGVWGIGLIGYWQPTEGCYRLSNFGNILALWRETASGAKALAAARRELKAQAYRVRFQLRSGERATMLRGKIWALGEREPDDWMISADDYERPLRWGRPGLFTARTAALFMDFTVMHITEKATADTPVLWQAGTYWHFLGGEWQQTPNGLRQNAVGSAPGFRAAAYAIPVGWHDCTIQVSVCADSGSRNQGFGLAAYWLDENNYIAFGQTNGALLFLARQAPAADFRQLATTPLAFRKGLWYTLKLQLRNEKSGLRLRAKAWPTRAGEPTQWQLEALDDTSPQLFGGDIGLWAIDDVASFDELRVTRP